jgi:hypothetical protein
MFSKGFYSVMAVGFGGLAYTRHEKIPINNPYMLKVLNGLDKHN